MMIFGLEYGDAERQCNATACRSLIKARSIGACAQAWAGHVPELSGELAHGQLGKAVAVCVAVCLSNEPVGV